MQQKAKNLKKITSSALADTGIPFRLKTVPTEVALWKSQRDEDKPGPPPDSKYKGFMLVRADKSLPWEATLPNDGRPNAHFRKEAWVISTGPDGKEVADKITTEWEPLPLTAQEFKTNFYINYLAEIDFGLALDGTPRVVTLPCSRPVDRTVPADKMQFETTTDTFDMGRAFFGKVVGSKLSTEFRRVDLSKDPPFLVLTVDRTGEYPLYDFHDATPEEQSRKFQVEAAIRREVMEQEAVDLFDPKPNPMGKPIMDPYAPRDWEIPPI